MAGRSTATVSRAFHEPGKIRPGTRDEILALAARLRYYPSPSGRALVKGRHDVLGLIWPLEVEGAEAPFVQRILSALTSQLVRNDLDLLICPIDRRQPATLAHAHRTLQRSRCDAWILLYARSGDVLTESLRASGKPVICLLGRLPQYPAWKWVRLNQRRWIEDALRRLRAGGARRVLFWGCRAGETDHEERLEEFTRLAPRYFPGRSFSRPAWPPTAEALSPLLSELKVDAIIGVDSSACAAALRACLSLEIRVPGRMQIVGIDELPESERDPAGLSTFRQPLDEMVAYAVDLALGRQRRSRVFEPVFVAGSSMRSPRASQ